MTDILLGGVLYFVILGFAMVCTGGRRVPVIGFASLWFVGVIALAMANYHYGWIEQKFASNLAFQRYNGMVTDINENFLFQGIFSSLAFAATDTWESAIGVNVAVFTAMIFLWDRVRLPYLLIFIAPAVLHIAMFAMRDVLMAATIVATCQTLFVGDRPRLLASVPLVLLLYMQRPELIGIFGLALGVIYFREFPRIYKILVLAVLAVMVIFVLPRATVLLGLPPAGSVLEMPDMLLRFFEARADRWVGTGGADTAMLGGQISQVPFLLRFPMQLFAFFLSPLPMDFRGFISGVFVIDSIFFIVIFAMFWRRCDRRHKIFLVAYIVVNALFVANYGNLFRLRMLCYFIMLSGFMTYYAAQGSVARQRLGTIISPLRAPA